MPTATSPTHVIAHLSDTHLIAGGAPLHGVDTEANLRRAAARLLSTELAIDAIVHTGDVADLGEVDAYRRARAILEPVAEQLGCPIVWVAGNHDARGPMRAGLLGRDDDDDSPLDSVTLVGGLRIIALDTSVPGRGHGELDTAQLDWLEQQLSAATPAGTVLALHHPPMPTVVHELQTLQLRGVSDLEEVVAGSDVRAVLAGHFHYATAALFGGAPLAVVPATSYSIRVEAPPLGLTGVDGGQGLALLHVYDDSVVHTTLDLHDHAEIVHLPHGFFETGPGAGTV